MLLSDVVNFLSGCVSRGNYEWNDTMYQKTKSISREVPQFSSDEVIADALMDIADAFVAFFPEGTKFSTEIPDAMEGIGGVTVSQYGVPIFAMREDTTVTIAVRYE
jgi:hypothetical protein